LRKLIANIDGYLSLALSIVTQNKFDEMDNLMSMRDGIIEQLQKTEKAQIKRIKSKEVNTRNSVLYFNVNSETKNVLLRTISMVKAYRDFVQFSQTKK